MYDSSVLFKERNGVSIGHEHITLSVDDHPIWGHLICTNTRVSSLLGYWDTYRRSGGLITIVS